MISSRASRPIIAVLAAFAVAISGSLYGLVTPAAAAGPVVASAGTGAGYVYDLAGRLATVISSTGETARHAYDPGGQITSIKGGRASAAGIIDINPHGGAPGKPITIFGRGFTPTPASNAVTIGGVNATVSTATASELHVTVPAGAKSGPVRVVTGSGDFSTPWS